jgi:hypothetical protein
MSERNHLCGTGELFKFTTLQNKKNQLPPPTYSKNKSSTFHSSQVNLAGIALKGSWPSGDALMSIDDQTWLAEAIKTCLIGLYFKGLTRNCLTNWNQIWFWWSLLDPCYFGVNWSTKMAATARQRFGIVS